LKELQGDTVEERQQDYAMYKDYIEKKLPTVNKIFRITESINNKKDNSLPSVDTTSPSQQSHNLKPANFQDLLDSFAEDKKTDGWEDPTTYKAGYQKLMILKDIIGNKDCSELTQDTAKIFLKNIQKLPAHSNKGILGTMTIEEKYNSSEDLHPKLSKSAIKKYVSLFRAVSFFGSDRDPDHVGGLMHPLIFFIKKNSVVID